MSETAVKNFTAWVAQTARDKGQTPAEVVLSLAERHGLSRYDYNVLSLATVMDIMLNPRALLGRRTE